MPHVISSAAQARTSKSAVTVALCFAVAVLEGFDIQALGVAAPKLAPEFRLTPGEMGWLFAISNVGLVIGASVGGWLADRVGRKPVFIGAVLIFGVFTIATTLAADFELLFVVRFLTGLGFGAALPNMMAVAAEISPPHRRASTAAAMFCGMPLGGGSSALLTQFFAPDYDWRLLFYVGGLLPVLLAPALFLYMPETLRRAEQGVHERPNAWKALFGAGRAAPTLLLWLTFFPTLLILYLLLNWLPTLAVSRGIEGAVAPQASLAFNYAAVAGALVFGRIVDQLGARWSLTLGFAALIPVLLTLAASSSLVPIVALSGLTGFLLLGANYALYGVAPAYYPAAVRGTGSGASVAVGRIGSVVGPLVAGFLLSRGLAASDVIRYLAVPAVLAGVSVLLLSFLPRTPE